MATFLPPIASLYRFLDSQSLDGTIVKLNCGANIPEGAVVSINSAGNAIPATATSVPVGVARYSAYTGEILAIECDAIVENVSATSLALTPGTKVFAGANGSVSASGTNVVGYAMTANKVKISV